MKIDKKATVLTVDELSRTNTFIIEDCPALWKLLTAVKLYNELNFERGQAYICYRRFEMNTLEARISRL